MNEHNSARHPVDPGTMESQLDSVLADFFRREIPAGLGEGQLDWSAVDAERTESPQSAPAVTPLRSRESSGQRGRHRGIAATISIATLLGCVLLAIQPAGTAPDSGTVVDQGGNDAVLGESGELMLVSPAGDRDSAADAVIGDHGLTIGETEDIDLSPEPRD
jgi:hypothetical protein